MNLSRRDFIKGLGAFIAGLGLGAAKAEAKEVEALPVPDATVELSTGYEVLSGTFIDYWIDKQVNDAEPVEWVTMTNADPYEWQWVDGTPFDPVGECDTLPECEDCQVFLDDDTVEPDTCCLCGGIAGECHHDLSFDIMPVPDGDYVRYPDGRIDVIGTIKARIDRANQDETF